MRRRANVDENQPEITEALRKAGASVQPLHAVGKGCPDLLVGYNGMNFLLEVKNPLKSPTAQALTPAQLDWHVGWGGQIAIVKSARDALVAVGLVLEVKPK
jgi:hypothetical protein